MEGELAKTGQGVPASMIYWPTALRLRIRLTPGHLITLQQHTLNPKLPLKHSTGPDLAGGMEREKEGEKERERERERGRERERLGLGRREMKRCIEAEKDRERQLNSSCLVVCVFLMTSPPFSSISSLCSNES